MLLAEQERQAVKREKGNFEQLRKEQEQAEQMFSIIKRASKKEYPDKKGYRRLLTAIARFQLSDSEELSKIVKYSEYSIERYTLDKTGKPACPYMREDSIQQSIIELLEKMNTGDYKHQIPIKYQIAFLSRFRYFNQAKKATREISTEQAELINIAGYEVMQAEQENTLLSNSQPVLRQKDTTLEISMLKHEIKTNLTRKFSKDILILYPFALGYSQEVISKMVGKPQQTISNRIKAYGKQYLENKQASKILKRIKNRLKVEVRKQFLNVTEVKQDNSINLFYWYYKPYQLSLIASNSEEYEQLVTCPAS